MAARMLIAALTLTALLVATTPAQAQSAGFCAYGICAGVDVRVLVGAVYVDCDLNLVGCPPPTIVPTGVPNPAVPNPAVACNAVAVPPQTGANGVVVVCV